MYHEEQNHPVPGPCDTETGDAVTRGTTEHCHQAESAKATKVKIRRVVKDQAEANLYKSAFTIAESVLLGT